jgi:diguanylate cyclase (GGDEF)-like protein/PAS domain S-box-containing protein
VTGDREHGRGDVASSVALATDRAPDGSRPGGSGHQPANPAFTAHTAHTAHTAAPVESPADPPAAAARHLAALDAIEEMACAPAQPSLLLELCVERARALVRAGGAAVQLLEAGLSEDEPAELLFAATSGMLRDQLGQLQSLHGTLCGTAIRSGEVVRTADAQVDPRGDREVARALRVKGAVSLPLRQHQRAIGVLLVVSDRADAFSDEDVTLLGRLARVASGRLDYALARDARRRSEEALSASRQKYRTVLASVEQGILVIDEYDRVSMVNPAAERILGEPAYELMRRSPAWVLQREDGSPLPKEERPTTIALREQRAAAAEVLRVVCADGRLRWVSATASPLPVGEDGRRSVVVCFSDVTGQRNAAERLRRGERLLAETQRLAHVGSWEWESPGRGQRFTWTDEMYRLAGLQPQSVMATAGLWMQITHPADRERVDATMRAAFRQSGPFELAQRLVLPTGEVRHLAIRGEVELGPTGRPARAWGSAQDVTERHRVQEELRRTALTDPLTGLGNRLLLVDRLQRSIAALATEYGSVAVIAVDLDGLKRVNDTHGHATGDELLRETGRRLRLVVRERDLVARLGGDEFVLLCVGVDALGATRLAERIVAEIGRPYSLPGGIIAWSGASVGVSATDDPADDVDRLLAQADRALYQAKGSGGNRYAVAPTLAARLPEPRRPERPNLSAISGGS